MWGSPSRSCAAGSWRMHHAIARRAARLSAAVAARSGAVALAVPDAAAVADAFVPGAVPGGPAVLPERDGGGHLCVGCGTAGGADGRFHRHGGEVPEPSRIHGGAGERRGCLARTG